MRLTRRSLVKAGSLAALGTLAGSAARAGEPVALLIYDSRIPRSRALAMRFAGAKVDVAREHGAMWRTLRAAPPAGRIVGLTRWNEHVLARGYLEEHRRRIGVEQRHGDLIYWEMK
ncbi:MAG: hypothetical protein WDN24_16460 [Sphingomonas sp.]